MKLVGDLDLKPLNRVFNYKYYSHYKLVKELSLLEQQNLELVLKKIPEGFLRGFYKHFIIDYRSEYLTTGQIPHISRWHYDLAANSQTDPGPGPESVHYLAILTSTGSLTEFASYGQVESNKLYQYTNQDLHRASPAETSGYRLFIRLSFSNHATPRNLIKGHKDA